MGEGTGDEWGRGPLSVDECIRAGAYWFGQSDFEAAEAWWRRALELDPGNERVLECLYALPSVAPASTGQRESQATRPDRTSWAKDDGLRSATGPGPFEAPSVPEFLEVSPFAPSVPDESPSDVVTDLNITPGWLMPSWLPPKAKEEAKEKAKEKAKEARGAERAPDPTLVEGPRSPSGHDTAPMEVEPSPWDEGPAMGSAMVVEAADVIDALPEPGVFDVAGFERPGRSFRDGLGPAADLLNPTMPDRRATGRHSEVLSGEGEEVAVLYEDPAEVARPEWVERLLAARDRLSLHDFGGAIELLEEMPAPPEIAPEQVGLLDEARSLLAQARAQLLQMYESKIGSLEDVPRVVLSREEVIWLNLNHRAGFILSQIDGSVTYEDLLALSGMSRLDTLRILNELIQQHVIAVETGRSRM